MRILALLFALVLPVIGANVRISDLPAGTPSATVVLPGSFGTNTFKFTLSSLGTFFSTFTSNITYVTNNVFVTNSLTLTNTLTTLVPVTGESNYCVTLPNDFRTSYNFLQATNSVFFNSSTNRSSGVAQSWVLFIEANGGSRLLTFNSSWKWLGTTNNPPTQLPTGKVGVLSITSYGTTETNIVAAFAQQP